MPLRSDEVGRVFADMLALLQRADERDPKCHPFHVWQHHFSKGLTIMRATFDVADQGDFHVVGPQVILEGQGGVYALCGKLIALDTTTPSPDSTATRYRQHFELLACHDIWARCIDLHHDVCHVCSAELTAATAIMAYPGNVETAMTQADFQRKRVLSADQYKLWEASQVDLPSGGEPEPDAKTCIDCGAPVASASIRICEAGEGCKAEPDDLPGPGLPGGSRSELDV